MNISLYRKVLPTEEADTVPLLFSEQIEMYQD